jgi:hypothetical protein
MLARFSLRGAPVNMRIKNTELIYLHDPGIYQLTDDMKLKDLVTPAKKKSDGSL